MSTLVRPTLRSAQTRFAVFLNLVRLPCSSLPRSVVAKTGHPILAVQKLTLEAIAKYPVITYDPRYSGRWRVMQAFKKAGIAPNIILSAIDADVCKAYIALGLGSRHPYHNNRRSGARWPRCARRQQAVCAEHDQHQPAGERVSAVLRAGFYPPRGSGADTGCGAAGRWKARGRCPWTPAKGLAPGHPIIRVQALRLLAGFGAEPRAC